MVFVRADFAGGAGGAVWANSRGGGEKLPGHDLWPWNLKAGFGIEIGKSWPGESMTGAAGQAMEGTRRPEKRSANLCNGHTGLVIEKAIFRRKQFPGATLGGGITREKVGRCAGHARAEKIELRRQRRRGTDNSPRKQMYGPPSRRDETGGGHPNAGCEISWRATSACRSLSRCEGFERFRICRGSGGGAGRNAEVAVPRSEVTVRDFG